MSASAGRSLFARALDLASIATTPLSPADYLELVSPLRVTRAGKARIEAVREEAGGARTLVLAPGRGWKGHRAGQYVTVGAAIDGRIVTRTYSIASTPLRKDGRFEITVKHVPGGAMSRHLVERAKVGEQLELGQAQGDFVAPEGACSKRLFVTAGSGITPVMSMLRTFAARGAMPDVHHVHYAPRASDVIFGAELAKIAAEHPRYRLEVVATRTERERARFSTGALDAIVPDWRAREAWACGPAPLLDAIEASFALGGCRPLHTERFRPKLAAVPDGAAGGFVRFGKSRVDVEAQAAEPLLAVAERRGVPAKSGCRMGICHSCDATLVAGCVRDLRTGQVTSEPGARIQPCVCAAAGDVEIDL